MSAARLLGPALSCGLLVACAPRLRGGEAERVATGKPTARTPLPTDTLAAYREALERDDPAAAYRLLSPTAQQHLPFEKWSARWKETALERAAQRKLLLDATKPLALQAAIALPQGTVLLLAPAASAPRQPSVPTARRPMNRPSDWQIAEPDLAAVHAETPEQVLHLLVEAVEQRNYFALLRLLSTSERKALETELRERVERLRNSLARPRQPGQPGQPGQRAQTAPAIEVHGDRARYQYDPRFFVDLVRERDGWRVLDLN